MCRAGVPLFQDLKEGQSRFKDILRRFQGIATPPVADLTSLGVVYFGPRR